MILRRLVCWGLRGGVGGAAGGCCGGVWGPRSTPSSPPPLPALNGRVQGVSGEPRLDLRGKSHLHTAASLSSTAFTWSRRRRRREEGGHVSVSNPRHWSSYQGGNRQEGEGMRDDEASQVEVKVNGGGGGGGAGDGGGGGGGDGGGDGQFFDHEDHCHHSIKKRDIGVKVNVGESVISALDRLHHIPRKDALAMVRPDTFLLVSDTAILKTLYYLKDHSVGREQLMRIPWILLHPADSLHHKFAKLQEPHLFTDPIEGLGFCWFSLPQIANYQRLFTREAKTFPDHRNRLYYLAERLEVEVAVLVEKVVKPKQVLRMDINRIDHIINIFKKYGVQMQDVVSDLWVFCHNVQVTEDRLRRATEAGCSHPKAWICHSSEQVFERYIQRSRVKRQTLGDDGDIVTYLSSRLSCSPVEVELACRRNPALRKIHVEKTKKMIDLLYSEGFTPEDLRACLRVLQYSEQRTKQRIKELKSLGAFPFSISVLYKRPETYNNIVAKIKIKKEEEEEKKEEEEGEEEKRREEKKDEEGNREREEEEEEKEVREGSKGRGGGGGVVEEREEERKNGRIERRRRKERR